jgi:hypothetical protein
MRAVCLGAIREVNLPLRACLGVDLGDDVPVGASAKDFGNPERAAPYAGPR